jgi:hypothetical protein
VARLFLTAVLVIIDHRSSIIHRQKPAMINDECLSDVSSSKHRFIHPCNIRLCAPDRDALLRSWFALLDILGRLGITVGDTVTHDDYAFLGMRHAASASERSLGPIVSIAEKTALKLRHAMVRLD